MLQLDWVVLASQTVPIAGAFLSLHLIFAVFPYFNVYTARQELVNAVSRAVYFF